MAGATLFDLFFPVFLSGYHPLGFCHSSSICLSNFSEILDCVICSNLKISNLLSFKIMEDSLIVFHPSFLR